MTCAGQQGYRARATGSVMVVVGVPDSLYVVHSWQQQHGLPAAFQLLRSMACRHARRLVP
jgi:hypothetical protein